MYPPTEMAERDGIRKKWLEATNAQFGIYTSRLFRESEENRQH
jgi:hypothetical protein